MVYGTPFQNAWDANRPGTRRQSKQSINLLFQWNWNIFNALISPADSDYGQNICGGTDLAQVFSRLARSHTSFSFRA